MSTLTDAAKNDALGQLYFLRAFAYFQLVRAYGPCPIHEYPVSEGDEPHKPRASVAEVYEQIIKDLKLAETMMFSTKSSDYKLGRPACGAASLLLAKVYLTGVDPLLQEQKLLFWEDLHLRMKMELE